MKDWFFRTNEYICDLRTVGVLVRDGKLLVQRDRDGNEFALPGGHVKIGETGNTGKKQEQISKSVDCSGQRNVSGSGAVGRRITLRFTIGSSWQMGLIFQTRGSSYPIRITAMLFSVGCRLRNCPM